MKVEGAIQSARVLIVEDNNLMRTTLESTLLLHNIEVVGTCDTAVTAMGIAKSDNPSVALLDLDLGEGPTGIDLAWGLRRLNPNIGIVILSSYRDPRLTGRKLPELPAGAIYLDKAKIDNAESLVQTILASMSSQAEPDKSENLDSEIKLNDSEIELLKYLWQGLSNSEIARIRNVTGKSAETAISRIAKKCGIKHSSEVNQRILLAKFYQELTGKTT